MFLAWNEIKHSKTRFALIIGVMILVSYLVFFLVGLAYGLAQDNRTSVDKWGADAIILTDESNTNINMSMMPRGVVDEIEAPEIAGEIVADCFTKFHTSAVRCFVKQYVAIFR